MKVSDQDPDSYGRKAAQLKETKTEAKKVKIAAKKIFF
jgi:hypothetical protein